MGGKRFSFIFSLLLFSTQIAVAGDSGRVRISSSSSPRFFAVVGAVNTPGVYEYSTQVPDLQDLIHDAGRLTKHAKGMFQIIRAGELSPKMAFHAGVTMPLLHGDVVIVAEAASRERELKQSLSPVTVVGLLERPVVLQVRPEFASVRKLMGSLNQNPNSLSHMKVFLPSTSRSLARADYVADSRLLSGSVILFDPAGVDRSRLPKLPLNTYKPELPKVRPVSYRTDSPRNPVQIEQISAAPDQEVEQARIAHSGMEHFVPPPLEMKPAPSAPQSSGLPLWTQSEAKQKDEGEKVLKYPDSDVWKEADPAAVASTVIPEGETAVANPEEAPIILEEAPEFVENSDLLSRSAVQWIILIGLGALMGGAWLYKRRLSRNTTSPLSIQQPSAAVNVEPLPNQAKLKSRSTLDALIENAIPMVMEPAAVPKVRELHSQPTVRKNYRIDMEHQIPRPPVAPVAPSRTPVVQQSVAVPPVDIPSAQEPAVPQPPVTVQQVSSLRKQVSEILSRQKTALPMDAPSEELQREIPVEPQKTKWDPIEIAEEPDSMEMMFAPEEGFIAFAHPGAWGDLPRDAISETRSIPDVFAPEEPAVSKQIKSIRVDAPQTISSRPHPHGSGGVLDRALGTLHGYVRQS